MVKPQHLVNISGGKDSTAVYLRAMELGRPFRAVFADTGNEHEAVYDYVARLHERTGGPAVETVRADFTRQLAQHRDFILRKWPEQGIDDAIVREAAALHEPTGNPYLDLCIVKGRFPSRMAQFCTEELKTLPIVEQVVLPMLRAGSVLQWLGIRAAESANRAKQPIWNRHESGCYVWRPIFSWSIEDVWAIHRRHGLAPNPLYAMGFNRVGCMPCINCRKAELRNIADLFPEHIERIRRWERVVAGANKRRSATFFAAMVDPTDADRPGTYSGIDTIVEWSRTGRGGRQFDLFFQSQAGGGCTSDLALCEVDRGET
ncbi:MAG TPA: phosphoadenosine phosphosulfate reductase family protein [Lysobacter sp.]|nr:phosphoadenosine phosphosulfate reductase family protein [Lysobacter sp.]